MPTGEARRARLRQALREARFDALICALPSNVAMISGYFPVVGSSVVVVTADGQVVLIVPSDECDLAEAGWADQTVSYHPGSLEHLSDAVHAIREPLGGVLRRLDLAGARLGLEGGPASEPSSYAAIHLFLDALPLLVSRLLPEASIAPADELLRGERAVLTPPDLDRLRTACHIAGNAFEAGRGILRPGVLETVVAGAIRAPLVAGSGGSGAARADGFAFCMSGPDSAQAYGAYARSRGRRLAPGDLVLVHCNSFVDGLWTDLTRTYSLGPPDQRRSEIYDAIFAARTTALRAVRPGATGAEVDRAARGVLQEAGVGDGFKHPAGHGVGFAAIDPTARPRIHPASDDVLQPGMVFNLEPAVYIDGWGGIRHCDLVVVTETGGEVLTPFQQSVDDLILPLPA